LKEKEHGLFTYYVLKGLGGDADDNQDKKLTDQTPLFSPFLEFIS